MISFEEPSNLAKWFADGVIEASTCPEVRLEPRRTWQKGTAEAVLPSYAKLC
ncbi:MAG: hypothetical protein Q9M14_03625 [Mariprofundaceae bacterium]|nr:hypothetical protein [Mariprofundaceae bacterium]